MYASFPEHLYSWKKYEHTHTPTPIRSYAHPTYHTYKELCSKTFRNSFFPRKKKISIMGAHEKYFRENIFSSSAQNTPKNKTPTPFLFVFFLTPKKKRKVNIKVYILNLFPIHFDLFISLFQKTSLIKA